MVGLVFGGQVTVTAFVHSWDQDRGIGVQMNFGKSLQSEKKLVDVTGFEPATPCLQSRCSPS